MSKKLLTLSVQGATKTYSLTVIADPQYLDEWQQDGLEIYELVNTIPVWVADLGLVRPYCFVQDILNFKNPLSKK